MSTFRQIGARAFTMTDQERFAALSGDRNPMHLDALTARRTIAGSPAVHGIHSLLWALETFAALQATRPVCAVKAEFPKFLTIQRAITLWMREDAATTRLEIRADGLLLVKIVVAHKAAGGDVFTVDGPLEAPGEARDISFEEAASSSGNVALGAAPHEWPCLTAMIGGGGIAAMLALTYLVGMVTPGLHSTFSHVDVTFGSHDVPQDRLAFRVTDARQGLPMTIAVSATALIGTIRAYYRPPPVGQPTLDALRHLVGADEFVGIRALIVGGSRGLGELTAKLLAAGGADVALTYAVGREEADRVSDGIVAAGGSSSVMALDVTQPLGPQLVNLPFTPNQAYYFATPQIARQKASVFVPEVFDVFKRFYLEAFYELCTTLSGEVTIFYPSSIFVAERPTGLTEYAMVKAAGEVLAADVDRHLQGVRVVVDRLPRMLTDQTSGVAASDMTPAPEILVATVRKMARISLRQSNTAGVGAST